MSRADDGSSDWIEQLYDRHAAGLYRYAVIVLTDPAAAADAVQQVFTKLTAAGRRPDADLHYLRRAVRNECFSALRSRRREGPAVDPDPILEAVQAEDDRGDERLAIERALRELPPEQREVVHLKAFEGMTFQEIADISEESINTVASRYRYALEKLRAILESIPDRGKGQG